MSADLKATAEDSAAGPATLDEQACREVELILRSSSHCELRQVTCRFSGGTATLSGQVSSYYLKQVAQTIVRQLPQVQNVDNRLRVVNPFAYPIEP